MPKYIESEYKKKLKEAIKFILDCIVKNENGNVNLDVFRPYDFNRE